MAFLDSAKLRRKDCSAGWTALLLTALLACAAVQAASAAKSPSSPPKSKPPPKPVVLKPPPKPVVLKPPASPPKPIKSKAPPKMPPPYPLHGDPFFCQSCATLSASKYYQNKVSNVSISEAQCKSIAADMAADLNATLVSGGAIVAALEPDCSSRDQIKVCTTYYFFQLDLPAGAGDKLARNWVWKLPVAGLCKARGISVTTVADLADSSGYCLSGHTASTLYCD